MQDKIQAIRNKVAECIRLAEQQFGVTMPQVQIRFDLKGRAAGIAGRRYGQFYLRFNCNHIALGGKTWEHMINDTVPHEVAHTVCQAFPQLGRNHNPGWKRVCKALGGNGERCYTEQDAPEAVAAQRPFVYITTAGHQVRVSKVIHRKIQSGSVYGYRDGRGQLNNQCQYSYMDAAAIQQTKEPVVVNTTKVKSQTKPVSGNGSKADLVRARIAQAKARSEDAGVVVQWAVETLGMSRSLAKTYVKNNW